MTSIRVNGSRIPIKRMDYRSLGFKSPQEYATARDNMRARFLSAMKESQVTIPPGTRDKMLKRYLKAMKKK